MVGIPRELRPSALERLPLSIRRVAQAACAPDCSIDRLGQLVDILNNTAKNSRAELVQYLPDLETPSSSIIVHAAKQALGAICELGIPAAARVHLLYRGFAWLQFLLKFEDYLPSMTEPCGSQLCVDFVLFSKRSAAPMVIAPGFLAVLAHAWKLLLKVEDSYRQADGLQCVFAFLQDVKNPVHCLEELTEGVGGSWDALASLVIDTISLVAPSGTNPLSPLNYNLLYGLLRFVRRFDGLDPKPSANLPPLCAVLASRGVVESLTIAVSALTRTTTPDPTSALETILLIFASIPVAARNGFFRAIIEGGKRRLLDQHVRVILDQILAPSSVYYTVLSGISEAFYDAHKGLAASEAFRRSPIFELIMKCFDHRIGVSQRGCDNPKAFRYCSKDCQIFDWSQGMHKFWHMHRVNYQHTNEILTSRERAFLRFLLHHDYLEARGAIFSDKIPIVCDDPEDPSFTIFNYLHGRVKVETFPMSSIDKYIWADHVRRALDSDGRMELHVMLLRFGNKKDYWILPLRSNSSYHRDSLVYFRNIYMRDGSAALVKAYENLRVPAGIVEIH
ncbi:hypothetical protein B0H14DRAFT_2712317 [Mycena olivaceomarginata]|nr:hypothetical protein B0H14DRAFT_2712317 [Mycena olivaceomarginata]